MHAVVDKSSHFTVQAITLKTLMRLQSESRTPAQTKLQPAPLKRTEAGRVGDEQPMQTHASRKISARQSAKMQQQKQQQQKQVHSSHSLA